MKKTTLSSILILLCYNLVAQIPCTSGGLSANLQVGLMGYYPFCGDANDESGNLFDGTVHGAVPANDRYGNANSSYHFDGINNYISLGSNFDLLPRTIVFWYRAENINSNLRFVYCSDNGQLSNGLTNYGVMMHLDTSSWESTVSTTTNYSPVTPEIWHQGVIVVDSNYTKKYLDGVLLFTDTLTFFGSSNVGSLVAVVGTNRYATSEFFQGDIDDIMIYNRVLADSEIVKLTPVQFLDPNQTDIKAFPNPFNTSTALELPNDFTGAEMKIFNAFGEQVRQIKTTSQKEIINRDELSNGVYFYQIINSNGQAVSGKLIVQ